ncbi:MAG: DUF2442 domain-containing protein [Caldilineaceae bacterium]|nr:DUF2442 domain-containing protein [Caldilineaceae bacterium]
MSKIHEVVVNQVTQEHLYLTVDETAYRILWSNCSKRLRLATPDERSFIDIAPSGYGLHWPLLDEDLAIDPLLKDAELLGATTLVAAGSKIAA